MVLLWSSLKFKCYFSLFRVQKNSYTSKLWLASPLPNPHPFPRLLPLPAAPLAMVIATESRNSEDKASAPANEKRWIMSDFEVGNLLGGASLAMFIWPEKRVVLLWLWKFFSRASSNNLRSNICSQSSSPVWVLLRGFYMNAIKKVCNYTETIKKGDRTQVSLL